ncbi:phosphate ABC transporter substrate-binding protein [Limosilactobacillus caecicola]|uniref:phosphate ABC transporter substrate-binding protein n=1 Tax=Limosilactobacillus caecicola TaxID=2941332 RepID=UPI00203B89E7|nr:phosphate ABC transporter substrate-binding protein [Limosilactobacillus caecicola]
MKKVITSGVVILVIGLLGWGWYTAHHQPAADKVTVVGSTALQPLAEAVAERYQKTHHANIIVQGGGSGTGLSQVQAGAVNIGASDIAASQKEGINAAKLQDHIVAVSGIVPVVNPKLGVKNLSMAQLRGIFTGRITNWQEVGGPNLPITVINRASGSGTRVAFEQTVLQPGTESINAQEQDSNGTVKEIVSNTPGAISYIALAYMNNQVQALKIDGMSATAQNITTNAWPLWSYEHMYTQKHSSKATTAFIRYMQSHRVQSSIVNAAHYVSIHDMQVTKTDTGQVRRK